MLFKIADVLIEVKKEPKLEVKFEKFRFNSKVLHPEIEISVRKEILPEVIRKKLLFQADNFWEIYSSDKELLILDRFNLRERKSLRIGVFDQKFKRGILSIDKKYFKFDEEKVLSNPLTYPIGPLILSSFLTLKKKGVFIHSSGIKTGEYGILFSGPSGSGKSTLAGLWQKRALALNDDRVIVRKIANHYLVYGCPWYTQEEKFITNSKAILKAIFFISHGRKNRISKMNPKEAYLNIIKHTYLPIWLGTRINFSLDFLKELTQSIDCFSLEFLPQDSVVDFIIKKVSS